MSPNPQKTADLLTLTEEILNETLNFIVQCNNFLKRHLLASNASQNTCVYKFCQKL